MMLPRADRATLVRPGPWVWASAAAAGSAWFTAVLLPLTGSGPLSRSSSVDVLRLARVGVLDAVVDARVVVLLLLLPALGLALLASAGVAGTPAAVLRLVLLSLGTAAGGALLVLVSTTVRSWGTGSYVVAASLPAATLALLGSLRSLRALRRTPVPTPLQEIHP